MIIDFNLFDQILPEAENSERGRKNFDLRTQAQESGDWQDTSQRMLNVLTPGTDIPIHRHTNSSETVIVLRGAVEELFYAPDGTILESHILRYGSPQMGIQVPRGTYHTCRCLEPGSVIFEAKDRAYDAERTEEFLKK